MYFPLEGNEQLASAMRAATVLGIPDWAVCLVFDDERGAARLSGGCRNPKI